VEAIGFITTWNSIVGNEERFYLSEERFGFSILRQISAVRLLEKPSSMS